MSIAIDRAKCCGCESCAAVCPVGAITMEAGRAKINNEECISCGACIGECFTDAITLRRAAENRK